MSRDLLKAQLVDRLRLVSVRSIEIAGGPVFVRGLTGAERMELQAMSSAAAAGGPAIGDYMVAAMGLCDERGDRLFTDPGELAALDGASVATIARAVLEASGLAEGDRETAAKN